ncbi:dihydrofolate reductase [Lederbergia citrisecunda]|uniref:dihydrofolate reductase n=1 Tax=Lederbergia citrisecunda TaxID=2833583 RepID=UPI003D2B3BD9
MSISLIACVSKNMGLGIGNELLFEINHDLQNFQQHTKGNIVICGRKTFDSIIERNGKPLSDRVTVLLTRNKKYKKQFNEFVFHDIESILKGIKTMGENDKKVFVIGGAEVYKLLLPYISEILLTVVDKYVEEADTFYPIGLQNELGFTEVSNAEHYSEEYNCNYSFKRYIKSNDK